VHKERYLNKELLLHRGPTISTPTLQFIPYHQSEKENTLKHFQCNSKSDYIYLSIIYIYIYIYIYILQKLNCTTNYGRL